jgi:riboflavin kinase / FMN adenylyltransferase
MTRILQFGANGRGMDGSLDNIRPCVVAIGNFDGVHAGHRELLGMARNVADQKGLPLVVLTFEPHPRAVLFPDRPLKRLTTLEEKAALLGEEGVEALVVLAFDKEVAGWSPALFIETVLVKGLQAAVVVVGENFRFGHKAAGDIETLFDEERFDVLVAGLVEDEGGVVSSSRLREQP